MGYRANDTDKQIVDNDRFQTKGAIILNGSAKATASIRKYDATHSTAHAIDTDVVVDRSRKIVHRHADYDAYRGESCLIGRKAAGNRY